MAKNIVKNGSTEKTANGTGNGAGKPDLTVGGSLSLVNTPDADTVQSARQNLENLSLLLGEKYETFRQEEAQILAAIGKARQEYHAVVSAVGKKHGLDFDSGKNKYGFDAPTMTFTRTA